MKARDIMTAQVVSVAPDTPTREVAQLLLRRGISAAPVVDSAGAPIGMISEGDLIGRDDAEREARRDWWLTLLAEGETLNAEFLAAVRTPDRRAAAVMSKPVVTVGEETEVREIARLLTTYRIKRVPVVRDGRSTGIVSRADLLRALSAEKPAMEGAPSGRFLSGALAGLDERFAHHRGRQGEASLAPPPAEADSAGAMAAGFRALVIDFKRKQGERYDKARLAAAEERQRRVAEMIDDHISDETWRSLLHEARQAAEQGQEEFLVLRFPSQLCRDGGRAINVEERGWQGTLRGDAAEIYLRWERDLKPHGFRLAARVLEFPGGMPGDIGLFLAWGE